jgi:hypothetical protein
MEKRINGAEELNSEVKLDTGVSGNSEKEYEYCVLCGKMTEVRKDAPVGTRTFYIDGCGQLCRECFASLYAVEKAMENCPEKWELNRRERIKEQSEGLLGRVFSSISEKVSSKKSHGSISGTGKCL